MAQSTEFKPMPQVAPVTNRPEQLRPETLMEINSQRIREELAYQREADVDCWARSLYAHAGLTDYDHAPNNVQAQFRRKAMTVIGWNDPNRDFLARHAAQRCALAHGVNGSDAAKIIDTYLAVLAQSQNAEPVDPRRI